MRTKEQIEELEKTHGRPYAVHQCVDTDSLIDYYNANSGNIIHKNTGPKVLKIDKNHSLLQPIIERMQKDLNPFTIRYAHFFDVTDPHIIHNDDEFEFPKSYKAFTIPLKIYGDSEDIKLVLFDQYYYGGPAKFFNGEKAIENVYYNKPIIEYSNVTCKNNKGIDEDFRKEYLGHLRNSWLDGLSIKDTLDWKVGDVLCFDSLSLHCSSNFRSKGIQRKIGLSIFTVL